MGFLYGVTRIKQGVPKKQDLLFKVDSEEKNTTGINAQKPDPTKPTPWTVVAAMIDGIVIVGLIGAGTVFLMNATGALTISVNHGLSLILGGSLTGTGILLLGFDLTAKMTMDSKLASALYKQQNNL